MGEIMKKVRWQRMRRLYGGLGFLFVLVITAIFIFKKFKHKKYYLLLENKLQSPFVFDLIYNGQRERVVLLPQEIIIREYAKYCLKEDIVMDIKGLEGRQLHKRVIIQKDEPTYYFKGAFVYYDGGYPDLRLRREG